MSIDKKQYLNSQDNSHPKSKSYLKKIVVVILLCNIPLTLFLTYQVFESQSIMRYNQYINNDLDSKIQRIKSEVKELEQRFKDLWSQKNSFEMDNYDELRNMNERIGKIENSIKYLSNYASHSDPNFLGAVSHCAKVNEFKSLISTFVLSNINVITPKVSNMLNLFIEQFDALSCEK